MRHLVQNEEQYLFQIAADFLKQMTELGKLREAVRLAEAAKLLHSEERRLNPKVVDPFAGSQLRVQPARSLASS